MYFLFLTVYLPGVLLLVVVSVAWLGFGQMAISDAPYKTRHITRRRVNMTSGSLMAAAWVWPLILPMVILGWAAYGVSLVFKTYVKKEFE